MMKVLAVILMLVVPSTAGAATIRTKTGAVPQPYAGWIDHSKVPSPPVQVTLMPLSICPARAVACVIQDGDGYQLATHRIRFALMHEMGHVFYREVLDEQGKHEFLRTTKKRWNEERFADAYGLCSISSKPIFDSLAIWRPTRHQYTTTCRVLQRAYVRFSLRGAQPQ